MIFLAAGRTRQIGVRESEIPRGDYWVIHFCRKNQLESGSHRPPLKICIRTTQDSMIRERHVRRLDHRPPGHMACDAVVLAMRHTRWVRLPATRVRSVAIEALRPIETRAIRH